MLKIWHFRLQLGGAHLSPAAYVNPSVNAKPSALEIGTHSRLYWGGDILAHGKGRLIMGDHSHLAPYFYCLIGANQLVIGDHVAVGPRCLFFCHSNDIPADAPATPFTSCYKDADIRIGNNVFIGAGCIVLPGTVIGDNVAIGAGSVIKGELESGWVYAGQPARKVKTLC